MVRSDPWPFEALTPAEFRGFASAGKIVWCSKFGFDRAEVYLRAAVVRDRLPRGDRDPGPGPAVRVCTRAGTLRDPIIVGWSTSPMPAVITLGAN